MIIPIIILIIMIGLAIVVQCLVDEADAESFWRGLLVGAWGICVVVAIAGETGNLSKQKVTDIIYNPRDSSWHLDIITGKDTVEVPVDAGTAAKFIHK